MKLLWGMSYKYLDENYKGGHASGVVAVANEIGKFLAFVDKKIKSPPLPTIKE